MLSPGTPDSVTSQLCIREDITELYRQGSSLDFIVELRLVVNPAREKGYEEVHTRDKILSRLN
jgi:hypothetical protein